MDIEEQENYEDINVIKVRQSIHNIKSRLYSINQEDFEDVEDDRQWILSHLKKKFKSKDLQDLFDMYTRRLSQAFFALLMLVQTGLFSLHFLIIILFSSQVSGNLIDLILYGLMVCLSVKFFFVTDGCGYITLKRPTLTLISFMFFLLLHFVNSAIPIYYFLGESKTQLRPAYTNHIIISCYVFFFVPDIGITVILGLFTTIVHILVLIFITYDGLSSKTLIARIFSDAIYLLCINGLGIYYRYLNEIIKRKSFLDRRTCVIFNRDLQYQKIEEEHLMDTIIPSYVLEDLRGTILSYYDKLENMKSTTNIPFEYKASFTQSFDNVTILYADVVNYTEMTVKLDIKQLLETLNELFGNFDDVSETLKVLRIKFLGDCYYCVSGLPPSPPENPAEACVDLGLEMIRIIAQVRKKRNININMRIGVHTGKIISGIIGYQKLHFDIWSKDVSLANQMETEGEAGKVHLTEQTKNLLKKKYKIEETNKGETVAQFKKFGIKTYLIKPDEEQKSSIGKKRENSNLFIKKRTSKRTNNSITSSRNSSLSNTSNKDVLEEKLEKKVQYYEIIETSMKEEERRISDDKQESPRRTAEVRNSNRSDERDSHRRTAFMNSNLKRYKDTMKESYFEMEKAIQNLSLSKYQQWFKFKEIHPVTLFFTKMKYELGFIKMHDPLFKYYLISEVFLVIFLFVIQNLTLSSWNWQSWWIYATIIILTSIFLPLTWMHHFLKYKYGKFSRTMSRSSKFATNSIWARLFIYTLVCAMFSLCVFSELINCRHRYTTHEKEHEENVLRSFLSVISTEKHYGICIVPWHMTQTCALAIIMSFLFLRMFMWVKFAYAVVITGLYSFCVWYFSDDILRADIETYNSHMNPKISHILNVVFLTITLHVIDRQTEYMNRLDYLWNQNLKEEQSKIQSRYIINKMLLNNVLPEHLTEMYLNVKRPPAALYHEKYANSAVMFASVVGYEIEDIEDDVLLTIMSEIIGEFDKLILSRDFGHPIEKIKVAKWTYMAACGVSPGFGDVDQVDPSIQIEALLKLGAAMIGELSRLNRKYLQDFKLRVGISNGEIVAGVVGSKKPLYDIWGDPVNMAARMDTTGEPNKIHVLERTVGIIKRRGYKCRLRGMTVVKGLKAPVPTYFVDLDGNFQLVKE